MVILWFREQPEGTSVSIGELRRATGEALGSHGSSLVSAIEAGYLVYEKTLFSLGPVPVQLRRGETRPKLQRESDLILPGTSPVVEYQRSVLAARNLMGTGLVGTGNPLRSLADLQDAADAVLAKRRSAAIDLIVAEQLRSVALATDEGTRILRGLLESL